ncbi:MAG TPA: hypothetical protein VF198_01605, partial [Vicinamibacterales bacterium]
MIGIPAFPALDWCASHDPMMKSAREAVKLIGTADSAVQLDRLADHDHAVATTAVEKTRIQQQRRLPIEVTSTTRQRSVP